MPPAGAFLTIASRSRFSYSVPFDQVVEIGNVSLMVLAVVELERFFRNMGASAVFA